MDKEIWKDVPGYKGKYQVSNYGKIKELGYFIENGTNRCKIPEHIIKPHIVNDYLVVTLSEPTREYYIHRLVAEAFIDNPENKRCVRHKSSNRYNNYYKNLEWCTHSDIVKSAIEKDILKIPNYKGKAIKCIETGKLYQSIKAATIDTNLSYDSISNSAIQCKPTNKGLTFEFI